MPFEIPQQLLLANLLSKDTCYPWTLQELQTQLRNSGHFDKDKGRVTLTRILQTAKKLQKREKLYVISILQETDGTYRILCDTALFHAKVSQAIQNQEVCQYHDIDDMF